MSRNLEAMTRALAVLTGVLALLAAVALLVWDGLPWLFPTTARHLLASLPLVSIATAYLAYQVTRRISPAERTKAAVLAVAFLFWAANQFWPDHPQATLFNDIAILLFVLDVLLVILGWPQGSPEESFAETVEITGDPAALP